MKSIKNILALLFTLLLIGSCKKDFINEPPKDLYTSSALWSDPNLAQTTINMMYMQMGYPSSAMQMSEFCDEAWLCWNWGNGDFIKSNIASDGIPGLGGVHDGALQWANLYKAIRNCNLFLENVNKINFTDVSLYDGKTIKKRMTGEAYFFRAIFNNYLVSFYGGVPIISKSLNPTDSLTMARNSYEECINFIVKDLDSASVNLPNVQFQTGNNYGRVTKGAALTLKSRVLLYAASDLHNPDKNASMLNTINKELIGYTTSAVQARWQAAYDASKAVMDLGIYSLKTGGNSTELYQNLFLPYNVSTEDIWVRLDITKNNAGWVNDLFFITASPNGYDGWGGPQPTSEMADSYEKLDGTKPDWSDPAFAADPFSNRDPRFYATIFHEGSPWRQRPGDTKSSDPFNKIQVGLVGYYDNGKWQTKVAGADTRQGPSGSWNGTFTGYNLKKYIDPKYDPSDGNTKQPNNFRWMRYAEVLLNRAEAAIELGKFSEAIDLINQVRARVSMPAITETGGTALRDRYRNERKVELAFEEHRFFDIRRWMIAPSVANGASKELQVKYLVNKTDNITSYRKVDGSTWVAPTYTKVPSGTVVFAWDNKSYFMPISRDEINKNHGKLIQNPGY